MSIFTWKWEINHLSIYLSEIYTLLHAERHLYLPIAYHTIFFVLHIKVKINIQSYLHRVIYNKLFRSGPFSEHCSSICRMDGQQYTTIWLIHCSTAFTQSRPSTAFTRNLNLQGHKDVDKPFPCIVIGPKFTFCRHTTWYIASVYMY